MDMEKKTLMEYLRLSGKDERTEEILEHLCGQSGKSSGFRDDLQSIWNEYDVKISGQKPDFESMFEEVTMKIEAPAGKRLSLFGRHAVAAAVLVPLFGCLIWMISVLVPGRNDVMCEMTSRQGVRTMIELSDGTKIWMNDCTTVRYPQSFKGMKERRIYMDGEAYFEVSADPRHPFIVENGMATTVVTGTRFNLSAYVGDNYFEAALIEGRINLEAGDASMELLPGNTVRYNEDSGEWELVDKEAETAAAWIDGSIVFDNENLEDVVRRLSRWFGIRIVIADPEINDLKLTARIKTENLDKVFSAISNALQISYEHGEDEEHNEIITIYNKITIQ